MSLTLNKTESPVRVVLCLIAKNDEGSDESHCVTRLLDSCRGLISSVVVTLTDTGTPSRLLGPVLQGWGERNGVSVITNRHAWQDDFAAARNDNLSLAREVYASAEWFLLLDADEELNLGNHLDRVKRLLATVFKEANSFIIPLVENSRITPRINLVRNIEGWAYRSYYRHETLELNGEPPHEYMLLGDVDYPNRGPYVTTKQDGARSRDPRKMEREIEVLQKAWEETGNPRYLFYLGIAHMAAGHPREIVPLFQDYVHLEHRPEALGTKYYALLSLGRYYRGQNDDGCFNFWKQAFNLCPTRVEAMGEIATWHAQRGEWADCYLWSCAAAQIHRPLQLDFVEPVWVQWRALDLLTVALINLGMNGPAINYLNVLLARTTLPHEERVRIQANLDGIMKAQP